MDRSETDLRPKPPLAYTICAVVLGLFVAAAAIWGANKEALGLFHDDGIYAVVAKAVFQGDGYRIISLPGEPPQTKYPFLYSYLLSGVWLLNSDFPSNILLLKSFNIVILSAIFFAALAFYRGVFPGATVAALVFAFLLCANPIIFTFTDYLVSDLLIVLFALGGLCLGRKNNTTKSTLKLALLAGVACLTRLAAAPLVFAGLAKTMLSLRIRRTIYFIGVVSLVIAPWAVWVLFKRSPMPSPLLAYYQGYDFSHGGLGGFGDLVADRLPIVASNARYMLSSFELAYLLPLMPWLTPPVAVLTGIGMLCSFRREETFAWAFFLSSLALLLVWPFHPGRYMAPLLPLVILFLFRGIRTVELWILSTGGDYPFKGLIAKLSWSIVAILLVLNGVWLSSYLLIRDEQTTRGLNGSRAPYAWSGFEESFAWVRRNTDPGAHLGTAYDPMYFLYTGRKAIRPALHQSATYFYPYGDAQPNVGSPEEIKAELERMRIDYLIVDPLDGYAEGKATMKLLDEIVVLYGDKAQRVFTSSDGKHHIYVLKRG